MLNRSNVKGSSLDPLQGIYIIVIYIGTEEKC